MVLNRRVINQRQLWDELLTLNISKSTTWIFMGDFNVVRQLEERINFVLCPLSANAFNQFIRNVELMICA